MNRVRLFRTVVALFVQLSLLHGAIAQTVRWPSPEWQEVSAQEAGLDDQLLLQARDCALSAGGSGMIIDRGRVILRWGDQQKRYDIKSATKSFGATMLGVALKDGKLKVDASAQSYHPQLGVPPQSNQETGWLSRITILQLATQTAGFDKPGGYEPLLFAGTQWHYSDGGPNWLAECITRQYGSDLRDVMFERVFKPIGVSTQDLTWRKNQYRDHQLEGIVRREFGAGIHANVEALSRLGYLYLREGQWQDRRILSADFVHQATRPVASVVGLPEWSPKAHGNASDHYGLLWWNNADASLDDVPTDAFWAWGLYDSLIVVIPSLDLVVVRGGARGKQWPRNGDHYDVLAPFLVPIVKAVSARQPIQSNEQDESSTAGPPYPRSPLHDSLRWAPTESIVRLANGSDNWPITWADDDRLYTAYGDGWGFEPKVEKKLSLGLATVTGHPPELTGTNLRSDTAERLGQGAAGPKASGMLMVDGVLYMLVRNTGNAQLAWSDDRGQTWTWSTWRWEESFGCPTFLNFGPNYKDARDQFVYVYSQDSDSAYQPSDRMVMARVPSEQIKNFNAYEYFVELDQNQQPKWTRDVRKRGAVFEHAKSCYRSGITFNTGLSKYFWCQTLPQSDDARGPRFQGGFGIYEADEPWGPWQTVYFTRNWDVGPGETSSLPTRWISDDGRTMHLLFSGSDCFSVRKLVVERGKR